MKRTIMRSAIVPAIAIALVTSCTGVPAQDCPAADYNVIPQPEVKMKRGAFMLASGTEVAFPEGDAQMERNAAFLVQFVGEMTGIELATADGVSGTAAKGAITLRTDRKMAPEAYEIKVGRRGIRITGGSPAGVFYGIQTLRKSLPALESGSEPAVAMPCATVKAEPRFAYRGMLFDTARHFFSIEFLKRYIDIIALHGCNRLHWHLTDDQGWRFEVKAYPLLTEIGSFRPYTQVGTDRINPTYDGIPHGGFYTQDECRELVAYAAERNIEIIPEIDIPGHMQAALAAYPELGCTGGPYEVRTTWGISKDVLCAGNPASLEFIKAVLDEVMEVFPSRLIHIGGDECPRARWHDCPKCQAMAAELGYEDGEHPKEAYLQTYIMNEVDAYLNAHGRSIVGWDEMLEGDLSPNATVMAWQALRCGSDAVKGGHPVIMSPMLYCYFDFEQVAPPPGQKLKMSLLPLRRVYDLEPVPAGLSAEEEALIMGVQANEWGEYIPDEETAEFQLMPRLAALAEVQWLPRGRKDYFRFMESLPRLKALYDRIGVNYFAGLDETVNIVTTPEGHGLKVSAGVLDGAPIHYTLDGSEPTVESPIYEGPLMLTEPLTLKMAAAREAAGAVSGGAAADGASVVMSGAAEMRCHIAKSTFKPITLKDEPALVHSYDGAGMLTDGLKGPHDFRSGYWLGFEEKDVVATIDMGEAVEISTLNYSVCVYTMLWLFNAVSVEVSASQDGKEFTVVASEVYPEYTDHHYEIDDKTLSFEPVTARYFRVKIECPKVLPEYHNGRSHALYMFVDEIALD